MGWDGGLLDDRVHLPLVQAKLDFGIHHTLVAALLERKLNELLLAREVDGFDGQNATLFPFRPGDAVRLPVTDSVVQSLATRQDDTHPGHDLRVMHGALGAAILPPGQAPNDTLRALTTDIYRLSSLNNNISPGTYVLPFEALRQFLRTGKLPDSYEANTSVSPTDRAVAFNAAKALLAGLPARPTTQIDLLVTETSFGGGCTTLVTANTQSPRDLFADNGFAYQFPDSFPLVPGCKVRVLAYTDLVDDGCPAADLEVITAELIGVPPAPIMDVNRNLLPDAWECLFFSGSGDPNGDSDGDGNSNLQEYLDGTDPTDPLQKTPVKVDLGMPPLAIAPNEQGELGLGFKFPANYASKFVFSLLQTDDLGDPFVLFLTPVPDGNGQFALLLPAVQKNAAFYQLKMALKLQ